MTTILELEEAREMQRMANAAVTIASHVNAYITKHCLAQMRDDPSGSIFLEAMTVSYVVSMRSFNLYKSIDEKIRPSWEKLEEDAIFMLKTTFKQIKEEIEKEVLSCKKH